MKSPTLFLERPNSIEHKENKDDQEEENREVNTINLKMISDRLTCF
jgi:hypothetical protein